jgi:hypothetical protein
MGQENCAGKNLGMLEIQMVMVYMIQAFELQFADGYDEEQWEDKLKNYLLMQKGTLPVVVTSRATQLYLGLLRCRRVQRAVKACIINLNLNYQFEPWNPDGKRFYSSPSIFPTPAIPATIL